MPEVETGIVEVEAELSEHETGIVLGSVIAELTDLSGVGLGVVPEAGILGAAELPEYRVECKAAVLELPGIGLETLRLVLVRWKHNHLRLQLNLRLQLQN